MFSSVRLAPYLRAADGDLDRALALYRWNLEVSSGFYAPLHFLEVASRNAMHTRLREKWRRDDWWRKAPLSDEGRRKVDRARRQASERLARSGRRVMIPDDVVAELTFGFWVELLSRPADRDFWVPSLHGAFPGYRGRRAELYRLMKHMVLFRNRIMHYEPVHHRDLGADHRTLYLLLGCLSGEMAELCRELDAVPALLARRPDPGSASR
ncbi:hypothetical protein [Actinomadura flavalba]|uniref:hypothetical protein n=1 Tax=Actinomadura flavalba TaxID=1120938 RepID=UPI000371CC16|nr:hypothetical protein [Actinomadura flavalba]